MRLDGIDGGHLFGYMAGLGTLVLLDEYARSNKLIAPKLHFERDGKAVISDIDLNEKQFFDALLDELKAYRLAYESSYNLYNCPSDIPREAFVSISATQSRKCCDILAGLACIVSERASESTLCAANGAGHQCLIRSIRDILSIVEKKHLEAALTAPWKKDFEVDSEVRDKYNLGSRKPTLRLDPSDERLYAYRFSDPTKASDFTTELGAQALAVPGFSILPVLPRQKAPICVASGRRSGGRVNFSWVLWDVPASIRTVRSLVYLGINSKMDLQARGAFASYTATRVSGAKGKLSFAPTEGVW